MSCRYQRSRTSVQAPLVGLAALSRLFYLKTESCTRVQSRVRIHFRPELICLGACWQARQEGKERGY